MPTSGGFFTKHNLDVEFVKWTGSTDLLLEAISTVKADAGIGMILRWLKPMEQGFDVKLTAGTHGGCMHVLAAADSGMKSLTDLRGKRLGVGDISGVDKNFFSIVLQKKGIDPVSDVEWKQFPPDMLGGRTEKWRDRRTQHGCGRYIAGAGVRLIYLCGRLLREARALDAARPLGARRRR